MPHTPTPPSIPLTRPRPVLARARRSRTWAGLRTLPFLGLILILVGTLLLLVFTLGSPWSLLLIVPAAPAILGGWLRKPILQKIGVGFMALLSVGWLAIACFFYADDISTRSGVMFSGLSRAFGHFMLGLSIFTGLSARLLSRPWWLAEDEMSEEEGARAAR